MTLRAAPTTLLLLALSAFPAAGQQGEVKRVMDAKLVHAQAVLGAVVKSDWPTLARESRALEALTRDPAWAALVTAENRHRTDMFRLVLQDLTAAADKQDMDDAAMAQVAMNLNCVRCHQLLARTARKRDK
jgi:hypothetical protein